MNTRDHSGTPGAHSERKKSSRRNRLLERYGTTAVVIGASEGIGRSFAEELARSGFNLLLVARRPGPLEDAAEEIRGSCGVEVTTLSLDLSQPDPWPGIQKALGTADWGLLVYNAAASPIGPFLDMDITAARRTVAVNVAAPMDIVHAAGNEIRRRYAESGRRGGIILMSSLSGLRGTPTVSAYAATKAWNLVLAEGVGEEARAQGVDLMACIAGATDTPGYRDSLTGKGPSAPLQSPRAVAAGALRALGHRTSMISGGMNRLIAALMYGLIPRRWSTRMLGRATASLRRRNDAGL